MVKEIKMQPRKGIVKGYYLKLLEARINDGHIFSNLISRVLIGLSDHITFGSQFVIPDILSGMGITDEKVKNNFTAIIIMCVDKEIAPVIEGLANIRLENAMHPKYIIIYADEQFLF